MENFNAWFGSLFQDGDVAKTIIGALIILVIGYLVASFIKRMIYKLIMNLNMGSGQEANKTNLAKTISKLVYYLLMAYVLLLVLNKMGFSSVLTPLSNMIEKVTKFIPNIALAGLVGFIGYKLADIARDSIGLFAGTLDSVSDKLGITGSLNLTKLLQQLVFIIIFVSLAIAALDILNIAVITDPAKEMLGTVMNAIPKILLSALILGVVFIVGRYAISVLTELLVNLGADDLPTRMGITSMIGEGRSLSKLIGNVAFFFLMFLGTIMAVDKLEFGQFGEILRDLFDMTGRIFLGLVIMVIGNFISNKAADYMDSTGADGLATIVRFATLGLFLAISLRTMGLADDIVNLAFGLTLGAVSIAFALAFGLGGREAAGKQMEYWLQKFRDNN